MFTFGANDADDAACLSHSNHSVDLIPGLTAAAAASRSLLVHRLLHVSCSRQYSVVVVVLRFVTLTRSHRSFLSFYSSGNSVVAMKTGEALTACRASVATSLCFVFLSLSFDLCSRRCTSLFTASSSGRRDFTLFTQEQTKQKGSIEGGEMSKDRQAPSSLPHLSEKGRDRDS